MPLLKVEGAGNDFLLATGTWAERLDGEPLLTARLCDRRRGVGGDGSVALFAEAADRVRMVYRNADGSPAPFCANATRCAARVAVDRLGLPPALVVLTGRGEVPAEVTTEVVRLELEAPESPPSPIDLEAAGRRWRGWQMTVGVPHLVLAADDLDDLDLEVVGPALRAHRQLGDGGANVNLVAVDGAGRVRIRSWERGVEGETLCCGSGVVAAALLELAARGGQVVTCRPRSGDRIEVEALGTPPMCAARLSGPARIVAEVSPDPAWLRG